jgi:tyrosinase
MRKVINLGFVVFTMLLLLAFANLSTTGPVAKQKKPTSIECAPPLTVQAKPFELNGMFKRAPMVRKNIYNYTAAEIASLKAGITAMKALPVTNPTSWGYQAAIHGTTLTNNLQSWNSCQHNTQFFLSWHRMYLYFFERILRAKSGNPNLTLPYWNYQTNPVIHPDYRANTAGNPLFHVRGASMNAGGSLSPGIMTSINNSLNLVPFYSFQSMLEGPHGSIHGAVGGDMGAVQRSAKDPLFWLHHTNIDRLWEAWLRKCGGRSNPPASDATWMNQNFTFFDENGTAISMTGNQIVSTATQLNYRYDFPLMLACNFKFDWWKYIVIRRPLIRLPDFKIAQRSVLPLMRGNSDSLKIFIQREKRENLKIAAAETSNESERLLLELDDIKINKVPDGAVEIYFNLLPNEVPTPDSKKFVGVLDLFSSSGHNHGNGRGKTQTVDATAALQASGIKLSGLNQAQLTFFVRGNTVNGRAVQTDADVQVGSMNFVVERLSKQ